jgi:hypothetical protein
VLVIDALDEVAAAREQDTIQDVLTKLEAAGSPRFVISCRGADWRGAIARADLLEDYDEPPLELRLQPLSRDEAMAHLVENLDQERAKDLEADLK